MSVDHEQYIVGESKARIIFPFSGESLCNVTELQLGQWSIRYIDAEVRLPQEINEQALNLLNTWQNVYPKEDTWVQRNYGVPSLLVRIDGTVVDGQLKAYEIEDRPQGAGLSLSLNSEFKSRLEKVRETWPRIVAVVSENRKGTDDHLIYDVVHAPDPSDKILVRAEPWEADFHKYQSNSVSTVLTEGDKSYGESMGFWNRINFPEEVDWNKACVVKPLQGSKAKDVMVWIPDKMVYGQKVTNGVFTRTKIGNMILAKNGEGVYVQPFYPPIPLVLDDETQWMALRIFYGYNLQTRQWEALGGLSNSRKNMIIHGAQDTTFNPINIAA